MKKFRANYGTKIEEFEIIKETEKQIVYKDQFGRESREGEISGYSSWHDTKEDAINYLIHKKQVEIDNCVSRIEYYKTEIEKIKKL